MMVCVIHKSGESYELFPDEPDEAAANALAILKRMRWAKVRRYGRPGHRFYIVEPRNPAEHKNGPIEVEGHLVRLVP